MRSYHQTILFPAMPILPALERSNIKESIIEYQEPISANHRRKELHISSKPERQERAKLSLPNTPKPFSLEALRLS